MDIPAYFIFPYLFTSNNRGFLVSSALVNLIVDLNSDFGTDR